MNCDKVKHYNLIKIFHRYLYFNRFFGIVCAYKNFGLDRKGDTVVTKQAKIS